MISRSRKCADIYYLRKGKTTTMSDPVIYYNSLFESPWIITEGNIFDCKGNDHHQDAQSEWSSLKNTIFGSKSHILFTKFSRKDFDCPSTPKQLSEYRKRYDEDADEVDPCICYYNHEFEGVEENGEIEFSFEDFNYEKNILNQRFNSVVVEDDLDLSQIKKKSKQKAALCKQLSKVGRNLNKYTIDWD